MPVNKNFIIILLLLACGACITPYEPVIDEVQEVLVINGMITDEPGVHRVIVSKSTPYNDPSFIPVPGCVITVQDESGEMVFYREGEEGIYEAYLGESFLAVGKLYALHAVTPDGSEFRSEYDTLLACPPVESIYYEVMSQGTTNPDVSYDGIQFYNDVSGMPGGAKNYRWNLYETWEYTTPYVAEAIWLGGPVLPFYTDTIHTCYMTSLIRDMFAASTRSLSENKLQRNPLNYVSNRTPKIKIQYSLLVEQQSLTQDAYLYWDDLKAQAGEGGGLYETQPASSRGNIYNVHLPEEKVLGLFYATQKQRKRIVVENTFDFDVPGFSCELDTAYSTDDLGGDFPYYLIPTSPLGIGPPWEFGDQRCFDCRVYGGVVEEPDYW